MGAPIRQNFRHALQTLAFAALLAVSALPAHAQDITSNLVIHFELEETSGSSISDSSPNSITSAWFDANNNIAEESTTGYAGNGASFASGAAIYTADETMFDFDYSDSFSYAAWVYLNSNASLFAPGVLIDKDDGGQGYNLSLYEVDDAGCSTNCLQFTMGTSNGDEISVYGGEISTGGWHHIAIVYDGSGSTGGVTFYVDGVSQSSTALSSDPMTGNSLNDELAIFFNNAINFDAVVDEIRVYSRELALADVQELAGVGGGGPSYTGPVTCDADYEAVMWYNDDLNVMQYCNGSDWISMGKSMGDWSPLNLTTPPTLWFDATDASTIAHSGGSVTTWTDKVSGRIASLDAGSGNPDYSTTQFNGTYPGIAFDGSDRMLGTITSAIDGDSFAFVVINTDGTNDGSGFGQVFSFNAGAAAWNNPESYWVGIRLNTQIGRIQANGSTGSVNMSSLNAAGDIVYGGVRSSTDEVVGLQNGQTPLNTTARTVQLDATSDDFYIGGDAGADNYEFEGTIGEIIALDYEPSSTEREKIEGYLAHKWGLESQLPGGHTYLASPPGNVSGGSGTCSSPNGVRGETDYNLSEGQMQYCNGADWISMGPKLANGGVSSGYEEPTTGLLGHWTMDDSSGGSVVDEISGYNGTWQDDTDNAITTESVTGQRDDALDFEASDNAYVDFAPNTDYDNLSAMTVCTWFKPESTPGAAQSMVNKRGDASFGTTTWSLQINSAAGEQYEFESNYNDEVHTANGSVNYGTWQHVCATWDGSNTTAGINMYLDGVLANDDTDETADGYTDDAAYDLEFCFEDSANSDCDGVMDDVRIYDRVLSAEEINALYETVGGASLIGHWTFDEGSGLTAADSSASGNNGALSNGPSWEAGVVGSNALNFSAANSHVTVANPTSYNLGTADFSIAAWVKRDGAGGNGEASILAKIDSDGTWAANGKNLYIAEDGESRKITFDAWGVGTIFSDTALDDNWHHVAVTFNDTTNLLTFYLDGESDGSNTLALGADDASDILRIGARNAAVDQSLDDVRLYNRPLTDEEIAGLYINTGGTSVAADCTGLGDAQYTAANGNCYFRVDSTADWPTAKANCEAQDAYLAVITSAEENTAVYTNLSIGGTQTYIGGSDIDSEGSWVWGGGELSGTEFWSGTSGGSASNSLFSKWAPGEPNAGTAAQDALSIALNGDDEWADSTSTIARPYICEKSASTGARCSSPPGASGEIIYNDTQNLMQGCAGGTWVTLH